MSHGFIQPVKYPSLWSVYPGYFHIITCRNIAGESRPDEEPVIFETTKPGQSQLSWVNLVKELIELG